MITIKTNQIIEITNGKLLNGNPDDVWEKIEIDSRKVNKDTIFMPILGEVQDGHIFIEKAFENGAVCSFCEKNFYSLNSEELMNKNLILVEDTTKALHDLTTYVLNECNVKTVGITGSLGKTSTKEMVSCVLSTKYNVHKNKGNFNNHVGLPLTVFELNENHDIAVLEMGMNHFKEIETLADIVRPDVAIITNIGTSHIGNLGSREGIFKAKMEIVTYFDEKNTLILNSNDEYLKNIESDEYSVLKTGVEIQCELSAYDLKARDNGCYSYKFDYDRKSYLVNLNVLGKHNVNNSLLALAVGLKFSIPMELCIKGLEGFVDNEKRLELINIIDEIVVINDCYNASSESMISAIEVLVEMKGNRKIAILGDVLELGEFSVASHESVGEYIYNKEVDLIITLGEASRNIGKKAIELGYEKGKVISFIDQDKLIDYLMDIRNANDVILVKGSFGMDMKKTVDALMTLEVKE